MPSRTSSAQAGRESACAWRLDPAGADDRAQLGGTADGAIAAELHCHPQTVRERLRRFNAEGVDGLGDRPGPGRKPRLTEAERSALVALARRTPPGRPQRWRDGSLEPDDQRPRPPRTGRWIGWSRRHASRGSRFTAAGCDASCSRRGCPGAGSARGRPAPTRTSAHKDDHRRALHAATAERHGDLRRRTRPGQSADLPAPAWLVT